MKKWFMNLNPRHRKYTILGSWVVTVVLFFLVGMTPGHLIISDIFVWLWLCFLVLSLVFTVLAIILAITDFASATKKKFSTHSHSAPAKHHNESNTTTVSFKSVETNQAAPQSVYTPPVKPESEKNYNLFDKIEDDFYLAYEYEEKIALPQIGIITGNGGKKITFKQEPDNEYDNRAVALYLGDDKIGYVYRGRTQDMVNDWIKRDDFFWGYINKIDVANSTATFKVGFYKDIGNLQMKSFRLTRITKKASEYESSRHENVECCSDGDIVGYETSFLSDNCIITTEYGNELGELGAKAVEWINENESNIKFARINNIEETESGGYKASIEFFYR